MASKKRIVWGLAIAIGIVGTSLWAQGGDKYKIRLAPVPALGVQPATVQGIGSASAELSGKKLSITGSFDKMASPATVAHLCLGPITGVRGNSIMDLMLMKTGTGTTGTISGSLDLTPDQIDALKKGKLYIQIHSEGAPMGHLMGWLLK